MPDGSELSRTPLGYGVPEGTVVVVAGATVVVVARLVVVVGGVDVVVVGGIVVVGGVDVVVVGGIVVVAIGAGTGDEFPQCHLFDHFTNCEFVVNVLIIAEVLRTVLAPEFVDAPTS